MQNYVPRIHIFSGKPEMPENFNIEHRSYGKNKSLFRKQTHLIRTSHNFHAFTFDTFRIQYITQTHAHIFALTSPILYEHSTPPFLLLLLTTSSYLGDVDSCTNSDTTLTFYPFYTFATETHHLNVTKTRTRTKTKTLSHHGSTPKYLFPKYLLLPSRTIRCSIAGAHWS